MYQKDSFCSLHSLILSLFLLGLGACGVSTQFEGTADAPSHALWTTLLQAHVNDQGAVDYQGFQADSVRLYRYLEVLSNHPPADSWTREERLAYWINAYNAFTVQLIVQHYPVKSIKDLHPTPYLPLTNTVWHRKFFSIGGKPMTLNAIEHKILRVKFEEPRIHFAIVCASISCPQLRREAYEADRIDEQLTAQARAFLADERRNIIRSDQLQLSSIFSWFRSDFTKKGSLQDFVNAYISVEVQEDAKISFLDYDWSLNE